MEFREIEEINKGVIIRIHDKINLIELLPYLITWLPTMTYQQLERCIHNNGEAFAAATKFLDQFRSRIKLFPKMLAALRHTKQIDVYEIFINEIRSYFQRKGFESRYNELMKLIDDAEKEFGGEYVGNETNRTGDNPSNAGVQFGPSNNDRGTERSQSGPSNNNRGSGRSQSGPSNNDRGSGRSQSDNSTRGNNQTGDKRKDEDNVNSVDAGRNSLLGATGTGHVGSNDRPPSRPPDKSNVCLTEKINRTVSGCKISELRVNVYSKLGRALQEISDEDTPWWEYLIENEDIEISRAEQTEIERAPKPGKYFLDLLDCRGYTLDQLQELFATHEINNALQILIDNQNKVVTRRSTLPSSDANNLNTVQEKKELPSKMNIPGSITGEGSPTSYVQIDGCEGTNQPINHTPSRTSLESTDDNTVVTDVPEVSGKGTQPVQVHGDHVPDEADVSVKGTQPVQVHGDRVPDEDPVYQNVSTGNMPCLSDLQSGNHSTVSNRDSGDLDAVHEATRNTNVEPKAPRAETVPITTGVHPVSASSSLGQIENRQNNDSADRQNNDNNNDDNDDNDDNNNDDASTETEAQVTMATNESSNTSAPLPTVLDDTSSSFNSLNVSSLNENNTDSELTQNEQT